MSDDVVRCVVADSVATVTLHRPDRLNALNRYVLESLLVHLDRIAADDAVRVVVLTGAGRAFSAGGDRFAAPDDTLVSSGDDATDVATLREAMRATELLHEMPKVTIAAVNGVCVGAALALACAADLRIASTDAGFTTAFLPAALAGDYGGTWSLPRVVGPGKARELYLLSDLIDAAEALRIGLVSSVVAPDGLADAIAHVAERICSFAPTAVALAKRNLNASETLPLAALLDLEAEGIVRCMRTGDSAAADAQFRGRSSTDDSAGRARTT